MKHLPRIAHALFCEPWAILPEVHASVCAQFRDHCVAGRGEEIPGRPESRWQDAPRGEADDPVGPCWRDEDGQLHAWHSQVEIRGTTAILPVRGIIGKHLSPLAMWCGGCDGALVARQARNIAHDDRVTDVVVLFDSPGGSCVGGVETANAILSMSAAGKAVYAYTDTQCCSLAYMFAAACGEIWAAPSAIVGSISTFSAAIDSSRAFEMEGLERLVFRSGEVKGAGTPGKAWTEAEKASMQAVVDQFSAQFKGLVADRRGISPDDMQGQYWPAEFAPALIIDGMADDLDELLAAIETGRRLGPV